MSGILVIANGKQLGPLPSADVTEIARLRIPGATYSEDGGGTWRPLEDWGKVGAKPRVAVLPADEGVTTAQAVVPPPPPPPPSVDGPAATPIRPGQLRRFALFQDFTEEEAARLVSLLEKFAVGPFQPMARRGSPGDSLYLLFDGEARVSVTEGGQERFISYLRPGEFFGEMALVDAQPRSADVVASTPCTVVRMTRASFDTVLQQEPRLAALFLLGLNRVLAGRLRATNERYLQMQRMSTAAAAAATERPGGA